MNRSSHWLAFLWAVSAAAIGVAQVQEAWVLREESRPGSPSGVQSMFLPDGLSGPVVLTGLNEASKLIQYDSRGRVVWEVSLDYASGMTHDRAGNIYVTTIISGGGPLRHTVSKYDLQGHRLWTAPDAEAQELGYLAGLAVAEGGVYITGFTWSGALSGQDLVTARYNPQGRLVWSARFSDQGDSYETAVGLAASPDGAVYVACHSQASGKEKQLVLKYSPEGNLLWSREVPGLLPRFSPRLFGIALDTAGDILVAGNGVGDTLPAIILTKFDPAGKIIWTVHPDNVNVWPSHALVLDPLDNALVSAGEDGDLILVKFAPDGQDLWRFQHVVPDSSFADNAGTSLAVDQDGNSYLAGAGFGTVKVSPLGDLLWATDFDGASDDHETAKAIAVRDGRSVYVAGVEAGQEGSAVLIKYADLSLFSFVRGDANGDGQLADISDAIHILAVNFLGAGPSPCWAAADADGDGETGGITDAVYLLTFGLLGGPPPPLPFPQCGPAAGGTDVALGCEVAPPACR